MVNLKGPLFSMKAQGQLAKTLIFKARGGKSFLTAYNKPGGVTRSTPTPAQETLRTFMQEGRDAWAGLSAGDTQDWNLFVIPKRGE